VKIKKKFKKQETKTPKTRVMLKQLEIKIIIRY